VLGELAEKAGFALALAAVLLLVIGLLAIALLRVSAARRSAERRLSLASSQLHRDDARIQELTAQLSSARLAAQHQQRTSEPHSAGPAHAHAVQRAPLRRSRRPVGRAPR
jgi:Tfp pilus assembly protein PilX